MIAYFDTGALVATYVTDACSPRAVAVRDAADTVATSIVSYAEVLAAFRTLVRRSDRIAIESRFTADWPHFQRIRLEPRLLPDIRRLLQSHALDGAGAIHVASAAAMARACLSAGIAMSFACEDRARAEAAVAEGLTLAW